MEPPVFDHRTTDSDRLTAVGNDAPVSSSPAPRRPPRKSLSGTKNGGHPAPRFEPARGASYFFSDFTAAAIFSAVRPYFWMRPSGSPLSA